MSIISKNRTPISIMIATLISTVLFGFSFVLIVAITNVINFLLFDGSNFDLTSFMAYVLYISLVLSWGVSIIMLSNMDIINEPDSLTLRRK